MRRISSWDQSHLQTMLNSFSWAKVKKLFPHCGFQRQTFPAGYQTLLGLDQVVEYIQLARGCQWKPLHTITHSLRPLLGMTRPFIFKARKDPGELPGSEYCRCQDTHRWSQVVEIGATSSLISWLAHIGTCTFWSLLKLTHDNRGFELGVPDFSDLQFVVIVLLFLFRYYILSK